MNGKRFEGVPGCECPYCRIARLKIENEQLRAEIDHLSRELHNSEMALKYASDENRRVRMELMPILDSEDPAEYVEKLRARAERAEAALRETVRLLEILGVTKMPDDIQAILGVSKPKEGAE